VQVEDAILEADGDGGRQARRVAPCLHVTLERGGVRSSVRALRLQSILREHYAIAVFHVRVGILDGQRFGVALCSPQQLPFHPLHRHHIALLARPLPPHATHRDRHCCASPNHYGGTLIAKKILHTQNFLSLAPASPIITPRLQYCCTSSSSSRLTATVSRRPATKLRFNQEFLTNCIEFLLSQLQCSALVIPV
jgi:hypothetical protein